MRRFAALGVTTAALLAVAVALVAGPTLAAGAPGATTGDASGVTDTQASLAGTVNPQGELTSYAFQYGTTTAYGQQSALTSAGSGTADVPVRADLSGLTAGTTYHYRVIATNASGPTVGADKTFRTTGTAPPPPPAPSATTGSATVDGGGAALHGSVNPNGLSTSYYFEFGETADYGQQTPPKGAGSGSGAVSVTATLSGLRTTRPTTTASSRSGRTERSRSAPTERSRPAAPPRRDSGSTATRRSRTRTASAACSSPASARPTAEAA